MKSLSVEEIDLVLLELQSLKGGQAREVYLAKNLLIIEHWYQSKKIFLVLDLSPTAPLLLAFWDKLPFPYKKLTKPVLLFLKAHLRGMTLKGLERDQRYGRVVNFIYRGEEDLYMELRLFPHGQNLLVTKGDKSLSWLKPGELKSGDHAEFSRPSRSYTDIVSEWLMTRSKVSAQKPKELQGTDSTKKLNHVLTKLDKERQRLEAKANNWLRLGKELKEKQSLDVEKELTKLIDSKMSFAQNLQQAFTMCRNLQHKVLGIEQRMRELQEQLTQLQKGKAGTRQSAKVTSVPAGVKVKQMELAGGARALIGKNAKENLQLLRKARAWDIWLHLKDYPGCYGFILRNKQQKIPHQDLVKVAEWVARTSFKSKAKMKEGQKFDVLYTECRFLRPIKGDKLGRVNYQQAKVLTILLGA